MLTGNAKKEYARRWFQENKARIIPARKDYIEAWRQKNMSRSRLAKKVWKENNKEIVRESNRQWELRNPEKLREKKRRWVLRNPDRDKMNNKLLFSGYKLQVIMAYGGHCLCCGESDIEFLTIEHGNRDGQKHRQVKGVFYLSLIRRSFPKDEGLSVLCMNCNWATRYGSQCPHKRKLLELVV